MNLNKLCNIVRSQFQNVSIDLVTDSTNEKILIITRPKFDIPFRCGGPIKSASLSVSETSTWRFEVLQNVLETASVTSELSENFLDRLVQLNNSKYDLCWGIPAADCESLLDEKSKLGVFEQKAPFVCFRSPDCSRWFDTSLRGPQHKTICLSCSAVFNRLKRNKKRSFNVMFLQKYFKTSIYSPIHSWM